MNTHSLLFSCLERVLSCELEALPAQKLLLLSVAEEDSGALDPDTVHTEYHGGYFHNAHTHEIKKTHNSFQMCCLGILE